MKTKTTKEIINDNMDRSSLPATPQFFIYMESPHYNPEEKWVRVEDIKEWLINQRQEPNDMFTIERLIGKFNELSQSSPDTSDENLKFKQSGRDTFLVHFMDKYDDGIPCGVDRDECASSSFWKCVTCPDCLKHKRVKS